MSRTVRIISISIYAVLLCFVMGKLFFEKPFNSFLGRVFSSHTTQDKSITIAYTEPLVRFHPLVNDTASRSRLLHVYEPLVRVAPDLSVEPALAISYGALDDTTWEFRLRPHVQLHDSGTLTIDDVLVSFQEARFNTQSQLRDLTSTITKVEKINDEILHITTSKTDPLLPQKIASILIYKQNADGTAVGTGPYEVTKNEVGVISLTRFENYWDELPIYKFAMLKTLTTKDEKTSSLSQNSVDVLAYIPADIGFDFDFKGFNLVELPSLETNFLLFNFNSKFSDRNLRQAALSTINPEILGRLGHGFTTKVDEFVANGIFGFDPGISITRPVAVTPINPPVQVSLDVPKGLELVGQTIAKDLGTIGIKVSIRAFESEALSKKIVQNPADIFFFGWRSDVADASDFLSSVAHSKVGQFGQYNGINYSNKTVDELIEASSSTLKPIARLLKLREAMKIITLDDIIGVPLFSPDVLYAVSTKIKWQPRVDSLVLAQEMR